MADIHEERDRLCGVWWVLYRRASDFAMTIAVPKQQIGPVPYRNDLSPLRSGIHMHTTENDCSNLTSSPADIIYIPYIFLLRRARPRAFLRV